MEALDAVDAEMTITAALSLEDSKHWTNIEQLWRAKADFVRKRQQEAETRVAS